MSETPLNIEAKNSMESSNSKEESNIPQFTDIHPKATEQADSPANLEQPHTTSTDLPVNQDTSVTDKPKDVKPKLGGAARKRFKWLLSQGHDLQEARILALDPIAKNTLPDKGEKRARSEESTFETNTAKRIKQAHDAENISVTAPTYRPVTESNKIGILHSQFPDVLLTTRQLVAIQDEILKHILEQKNASVKPKFLYSTFKRGWLLLSCADAATVRWLKSMVKKFQPWKGANLRIADEADIPRAQILVGYFPNSEKDTNNTILSYIQGQNEGLNMEEWRILRRNSINKAAHLTLLIDFLSFNKLKSREFNVNYKFGVVQLRHRSNKPNTSPLEKEDSYMSKTSHPSTSAFDTCAEEAPSATDKAVVYVSSD